MLFHIWDFEVVSEWEGAPISNCRTSWEGSSWPLFLPDSRHRQAPALFHISHLCVEFGFPIATESIFPITGLLWQQLLSCLETDLKGFSSSFGLFGTYTEIERAAIGTVLLLLRRKFWQKPALEVMLNWTQRRFFGFGRNQLGIYLWCCLLPATFLTEYNTRLTGYSTLICS